jgi:site-specific DNA recombinase
MILFALYARTSTDDLQSPEDSLRWQVAAAEALIGGAGRIVDIYQDFDVSRSIPWSRRPEGRRLLADLGDPERGYDAVVVGETARAFGNPLQVGLVLPIFRDRQVPLWLPDTSGPYDHNADTHAIMVGLKGNMAQAERNGLGMRVKTSKRAHAAVGRFQGGRPPYGYEIVKTDIPHPNPKKAADGKMLTRLEVVDDTAAVVRRIYQLRLTDAQSGYDDIAQALTDDGILCPSDADPQRNPHRLGGPWHAGTVRSIILNPVYKGLLVYGQFARVDSLADPNDPSMGDKRRLQRTAADTHLEVPDVVPAIVDAEIWAAAQPDRRPPKPGPKASTPSRYSLRGLVTCGTCGRKMQGNTVRGHVMYRCVRFEKYATSAEDTHPPSLSFREDRALPAMLGWLGRITDPDRLSDTVAAILDQDATTAEPADVRAARRTLSESKAKIANLVSAIADGIVTNAEAGSKLNAARSAAAEAEVTIAAHDHGDRPLTEAEVLSVLGSADAIAELLADASPHDRRTFLDGIGFSAVYHREGDEEHLTVALRGVELHGVGGGT